MNHNPASIIRTWIIDEALSTEQATFASGMPEHPNLAICVYDQPGLLQGRIQKTGETVEAFGLELRVRALDYQTGYSLASDICDAADALKNAPVTIDDHDYLIQAVTRRTSILPLGPESGNRRERFVVKFVATIRQTS